jgi:hypothetical protein
VKEDLAWQRAALAEAQLFIDEARRWAYFLSDTFGLPARTGLGPVLARLLAGRRTPAQWREE